MGLGTGTGPRPGRMQTRDRSQIEFDERESVNNDNSPGWRAADDLYMGAAGSSRSARPPALSRDSYSESEYDSNSGSGYAPQGTHSAPTEHNAAAEESCDLWVCLVCGFIGCGSSHCNHIRDHYVRHLHAYAMNTGIALRQSVSVFYSCIISNTVNTSTQTLYPFIYPPIHPSIHIRKQRSMGFCW